MSITHNKNLNLLLNLLISCTSARSGSQILPVKVECTFRFFNFLITGMCNPSANYWSDILSFLNTTTRSFFIKKFIDR